MPFLCCFSRNPFRKRKQNRGSDMPAPRMVQLGDTPQSHRPPWGTPPSVRAIRSSPSSQWRTPPLLRTTPSSSHIRPWTTPRESLVDRDCTPSPRSTPREPGVSTPPSPTPASRVLTPQPNRQTHKPVRDCNDYGRKRWIVRSSQISSVDIGSNGSAARLESIGHGYFSRVQNS